MAYARRKGKTPLSRYRPRSKYGAQPTVVDGFRFHSKREAARYGELRLRERAGEIRNLKLQPRYALCALVLEASDCRDVNAGLIANRRLPIVTYVADFQYEERRLMGHPWAVVVEDVKGMKTDVYAIKKRWFEAQYGIQVRET